MKVFEGGRDVLCGTMFRHGNFLWVSMCNFMVNLFWFIAEYIKREKDDHKPQGSDSSFIINHSREDDEVVSKSSMDFHSDVTPEKEDSNFSFRLLRRDSKEFKGNFVETEDSAFLNAGFCPSVLKYEFMAGKNIRGFIGEPESINFTVEEMFMDSNDGMIINGQNIDSRVSQDEDFQEHRCSYTASSDVFSQESVFCSSDDVEESNTEQGSPVREITVFSVKTPNIEDILEEKEASIPSSEEIDDDISYEVQFLPRNEFSASDLTLELESSSDRTIEAVSSDANAYQIFAFSTAMINSNGRKPEIVQRSPSEIEIINGNFGTFKEARVNEDTEEDVDDEFIELEPHSNDENKVYEESLSEKDEATFEVSYATGKETKLMDGGSQRFEEENLVKGSLDSDSDDEDEFDILLEHQQLVKQMKLERKNSKLRAGLPTISEEEECETPNNLESLKPLKIDEKFEFKDHMEEIQKFYKSYAEKMRKLDILNYQSLNAISFLQLKDSQLYMPSKKYLLSSIKPFSLPSFLLFKQQRVYADPTLKSINEMHRDLELAYVGQVCLSWEILLWQYGKVKELLEHNPQDSQSYNQVAGEYQQFQVLVQRFLEDERFQGPRIQHYVKCRCLCRSLLQVPCIKDDCSKDKKEIIGEEIDAVSITMLAETIKDSMQIFWEFIRAEKEEANGVVLKSVQADYQLLMNVRTSLEKKERKIKDIQRSGNCIVKKFQKQHQARLSNALLISQVELKLVSRVLNLSRITTDHLIWCQKKLNNISIINRKVCVEPAFLLFPC